jgi:protein TonB
MFTARIPFAAASGVLASLALFFALWQLVGVPMVALSRATPVRPEFTRQRIDTPTEIKRQEKPQRELPPPTPTAPRTGIERGDPRVTLVRYERVDVARPTRTKATLGVDRDSTPLVRINPDYPPSAQAKSLEGWVRVQFAVTAIGTVRDAVVVASEPRNVFDKAALDAVARWRYNPRIEGGEAVERVGLQTLFRFELPD